LGNYSHDESNIQELRALNQFYAGDFANGIETLKLAGNAGVLALNADPFAAQISDCISCAARLPHTTYTKTSFAQRMLVLSQVAKGRRRAPPKRASSCQRFTTSRTTAIAATCTALAFDLMISSTTETAIAST
jgi:hypothetical protein